jgi:hypothetical protein
MEFIKPIHGYTMKLNPDVKPDADDPNHYCKYASIPIQIDVDTVNISPSFMASFHW